MKIFYILCITSLFTFSVYAENMTLDQELLRGFTEENEQEIDVGEAIPSNEEDININDKFYRKFAVIRAINKITAKSSIEKIEVGDYIKYGNLNIMIKACWAPGPELSPENKILLHVEEKAYSNEGYNHIFYGWLFSSTPSVSSIEHPVYDIIAEKCIDK